MYKNKAFLTVIIALVSILPILSQNNTNSPYTRFGFGELSDNTTGEQRAMGGVAIGSRVKDRINPVNPASYSVADSLTFMFDVGISGLLSRFSDNLGNAKTSFNSNLDYITMQFRLFKGFGLSAGLLPYSFSGYNFYSNDSVVIDGVANKYMNSYYGTGGFSQVYIGLGGSIFNHVALGANVYYMFGTYDNTRLLQFVDGTITPGSQVNSIRANNFRFRFGAQFYNTFAEKHDVTLGLIYEPKTPFNGEATKITAGQKADSATTLENAFELPQMFGAGVFYKYDNKLSVGIDYTLQQWGDVKYYNVTDTLSNRSKISLGLEYQPNYKSRKYFPRVMYRAGFNMTDPYYRIGAEKAGKNYGITFGLGLPLSNTNKSMLNFAFEYGKINSYSALSEDYFKFTFNIAFNETWFFKRKL